jgi:hypothetical protein
MEAVQDSPSQLQAAPGHYWSLEFLSIVDPSSNGPLTALGKSLAVTLDTPELVPRSPKTLHAIAQILDRIASILGPMRHFALPHYSTGSSPLRLGFYHLGASDGGMWRR